jgi:hypothetical protein
MIEARKRTALFRYTLYRVRMRAWILATLFPLALLVTPAAAQFEPTAMWKNIKRALMGPDGKDYFENSFKDAQIPTLVGTVVSSTPAAHPNELLVAIEDDHTPEVKLSLERPLGKPLPVGAKISFEGVPYEFTKEPFLVKFNVENVHFRATSEPRKSEQPAPKNGK